MPCSFVPDLPSSIDDRDLIRDRCQFSTPDSNLVDFEGNKYCIAHLPLRASSEFPAGSFDDLFRQYIRNETTSSRGRKWANLAGVVFRLPIFYERFDPSNFGLKLPPNLLLTGAHFTHAVAFSQTQYQELVLDNAQFESTLTFSEHVSFSGPVTIQNATFKDHVGILKARFDKGLNLRHARFKGNVKIEDCEFGGDFSASECDFASASTFSSLTCKGPVTLDGAHFHGPLTIHGVQFVQSASFQRVTADGNISIDNSKWSSDVTWRGAKFNAQFVMKQANCEGTQDFSNVTFSSRGKFSAVNFQFMVTLSRSRASDGLLFEDSQLRAGIDLSESDLAGEINFSGGFLKGRGDFRKSHFRKNVSFAEIELSGQMDFSECTFDADISFYTSSQKPELRNVPSIKFELARFLGTPKFTNRLFTDTTSFRFAVFNNAPDFHGCTLHQSTDFYRAQFRDSSGLAESRYRTLRHLSEELRSRRDESLFFKLEQRARRRNMSVLRDPMGWVASCLYDICASYGESILKPLLWLFVTFGMFSYVHYLIIIGYPEIIEHFRVTPGQVVGFTVEQVVRPFSIWAPRGEGPGREWLPSLLAAEPILLRVTATLETLFGLGFFTLFLLALRRRFSMS